MIRIRKSEDRGHADHGWLDSHHTFSFADYFDPKHTQFRSLRVLNEDRVSGGQGFGFHPHRDMEIISYVVSGVLQHQDNMGNRALMKAGDVQYIRAGTGIMHSEYNASPVEPVHFLQIWITPDKSGVEPTYVERSLRKMETGKLHLIASKTGRVNSIAIQQDADVYAAKTRAGEEIEHHFGPDRSGWVQVIEGELSANGKALGPGDGAAISGEEGVRFRTAQDSHFLFFDMK
jgi:redox-sensitive bicupin YhaK (pirin superfamily)